MDILWTFCNTFVILFETLFMLIALLAIYGFSGGEINTKFIRDIFNLLFVDPEDDDDAYNDI